MCRLLPVAAGTVRMRPETKGLVVSGNAKKGNVLEIARIAVIIGAKHQRPDAAMPSAGHYDPDRRYRREGGNP